MQKTGDQQTEKKPLAKTRPASASGKSDPVEDAEPKHAEISWPAEAKKEDEPVAAKTVRDTSLGGYLLFFNHLSEV